MQITGKKTFNNMHLKLRCPKRHSSDIKRDWFLGHDMYVEYFNIHTYTCLNCKYTKEYQSMDIDEDPPEPKEWFEM